MATININVDENVKAQATELFKSFGLDMTTAMNLFLRQSIMYGGIPFEIKKPSWYVSSEREAAQKVKEAENEMRNGAKTSAHDEVWKNLGKKYGFGV